MVNPVLGPYRLGGHWAVTIICDPDRRPGVVSGRLMATAQTPSDARQIVNALNQQHVALKPDVLDRVAGMLAELPRLVLQQIATLELTKTEAAAQMGVPLATLSRLSTRETRHVHMSNAIKMLTWLRKTAPDDGWPL